ncbi:topoisomerase DNA-binding C4 zinc finger domain-containing protein [bacterium]|nr:topoisomerase DNA-binding C4 zinc finger domain-containing protein [bacterium]
MGCSNYPKCNYIEFLDVVKLKEKCPNCGGDLLLRTNKRKQKFIGCSNYPNCNFVSNDLEKFNVKNDQNSQK